MFTELDKVRLLWMIQQKLDTFGNQAMHTSDNTMLVELKALEAEYTTLYNKVKDMPTHG